MTDTLKKICADKLEHIKERKKARPYNEIIKKAAASLPVRGFKKSLEKKIAHDGIALIAEVKKASPSRGIIREDFDPVKIAKIYEAAGAACISVLTDEKYFQGRDEYLTMVRNAVGIPLLRKDFMLDTYQVAEARVLGADCILLIMAALDDGMASDLEAAAMELGMDVLVEVHDENELKRALNLKSRLIGINNRDLKTLKVDIATTERLSRLVPSGYSLVCESGIASHTDVKKISSLGVKSYLVGESLMREKDIQDATLRLLGKKQ